MPTPLRATLDELLALRDPQGVLTIYVDEQPELGRRHRPRGGELVLRSRLHELRERVRAEGPGERGRLLDERLDELAGRLSDAVDPALAGGGRAFFVPLSDGRVREEAAVRAMGDEVALEDSALLMPLVAALVEEEPAGLVVLTAEGVRAVEVRGADVEEVVQED
ncbi:MAG TPA: hypothetical protein VK904_02605, partial [Miltoncostaeaceae bacterium]|nr:hypothetical protein [Miltoncostaeaceae bacterium]